MAKEAVIIPISVVCSLFRSIPVTDVTMRQEVMSCLSKTQVKELLQKDVFTNAEKDILKVWHPTLFKLSNDELYKVACENEQYIKKIMEVKNLTDEQFSHWFDKQIHVDCVLPWGLVKWILDRKITDDQFSRLCQCDMKFNDESDDFFVYSESLGYSLTVEDKYNVFVHSCIVKGHACIVRGPGAPDYPMNDLVEYLVKLGSSKLGEPPFYHNFWAARRVCEKYNTDFKESESFVALMRKLENVIFEGAKELVLEMLDNNEISMDFLERTGLGQYVGLSSSEVLLSNV